MQPLILPPFEVSLSLLCGSKHITRYVDDQSPRTSIWVSATSTWRRKMPPWSANIMQINNNSCSKFIKLLHVTHSHGTNVSSTNSRTIIFVTVVASSYSRCQCLLFPTSCNIKLLTSIFFDTLFFEQSWGRQTYRRDVQDHGHLAERITRHRASIWWLVTAYKLLPFFSCRWNSHQHGPRAMDSSHLRHSIIGIQYQSTTFHEVDRIKEVHEKAATVSKAVQAWISAKELDALGTLL